MADYDAFISYSHAKDKPIAAAVQLAIQRLGQPRFKGDMLRVFRDDTSLSAAPSLWGTIEAALAHSRFFILLASPQAAASPWVRREIAYWLEHKSADTLLIGLTAGELAWDDRRGDFAWTEATTLPPALKGAFTSEPKWVDLRAYRKWRNDKFIDAIADFAATIRGVPKEDLWSKELQQGRRERMRRRLAIAAFVILGVLVWWQRRDAVVPRGNDTLLPLPGPATIPLQLPGASTPVAPAVGLPANAIVLTLSADRQLWIGSRMIDRTELVRELDAASDGDKDRTVYLRADRSVSYDEVSALLGSLRNAGYLKVAMVVQRS